MRPTGQIQGCRTGLLGKQRGGDPAKPPAEGRHTIKDLFLPINFSPSATAPGKEQSYKTFWFGFFLFICILAPSSFRWAQTQSRKERQSSQGWHNLSSPWRAKAAHRDQTGHQGQVETGVMLKWVFQTSRKVFSSGEIRNYPTVSGNERKIKPPRVHPKEYGLRVSFSAGTQSLVLAMAELWPRCPWSWEPALHRLGAASSQMPQPRKVLARSTSPLCLLSALSSKNQKRI